MTQGPASPSAVAELMVAFPAKRKLCCGFKIPKPSQGGSELLCWLKPECECSVPCLGPCLRHAGEKMERDTRIDDDGITCLSRALCLHPR